MLTEIHDYQIRPAEDGDLGIIAEILYQHYQPYDWWQVVNSKVEETTWLRITTDDLRQNTSEGAECASFVIEDAGVLAGAVRYVELKKGLDPLPAPDLMLGENASEAEDLDNTIFKEEMVAKYRKMLWLFELAVHMDYLGKGAAKFMMRFIIDEARKKQLNVAVAVVPDEVEWYRAWGFQEVHPTRKLQSGTISAVNVDSARISCSPHDANTMRSDSSGPMRLNTTDASTEGYWAVYA